LRTNSIDQGRFPPQAAAVFARAEKFRTNTLEPEAFTWEFVDRRANSAALREAARLGLTGIEVDKALGGLGLGFREKVRIAEILARSSLGFAFSLINSQNVAARVARLGTPDQRSDYLPGLLSGRRFGATALTEPHAGSDLAAIRTSAARTSSGWVLNGRKAWITNGAIADVILCYAQTDVEKGRQGIACFLVDGRRPGFEAEAAYGLTAGSAVGVSGFALDNYETSDDDLLIEPGDGFSHALGGVNGARIYVAAMACSMIRSALAEAVEYGANRQAFGRSLLDHQGLSWSLAHVANQLEAAEALTAGAVDVYEQSPVEGRVDPKDVAVAAAHAKKFAVEILEPSLRTCMQAMGAEGLRSGNRVGRLLTEARIASYVDGTTEMQTERIGRSLIVDYGNDAMALASVAYRVVTDAQPAEDQEPDSTRHRDDISQAGPVDVAEADFRDEGVRDEAADVSGAEAADVEVVGAEAADVKAVGYQAAGTDGQTDAGAGVDAQPPLTDFEPWHADPDVVEDGEEPSDADWSSGSESPIDSPVASSAAGFGLAAAAAGAATTSAPLTPPMPPGTSARFDDEAEPASSVDRAAHVPPLPPDSLARQPKPPMPPSPTSEEPDADSWEGSLPDQAASAGTGHDPATPPFTPPPPSSAQPSSPPSFAETTERSPAAPPLPGDEHRLDPADAAQIADDQDPSPSTPPLPPDALRRGGS